MANSWDSLKKGCRAPYYIGEMEGRLPGKTDLINRERDHIKLDDCIRPPEVICKVRLLAHAVKAAVKFRFMF